MNRIGFESKGKDCSWRGVVVWTSADDRIVAGNGAVNQMLGSKHLDCFDFHREAVSAMFHVLRADAQDQFASRN